MCSSVYSLSGYEQYTLYVKEEGTVVCSYDWIFYGLLFTLPLRFLGANKNWEKQ